MKERLTAILNENKLTALKFAEILGIQPSSLSHIFSGRNRASLDLIEKVLKQFPEISPDWLLFGAGEMYRDDNIVKEESVSEVSYPDDPTLFTEPIQTVVTHHNGAHNHTIVSTTPHTPTYHGTHSHEGEYNGNIFTNVNTDTLFNNVNIADNKEVVVESLKEEKLENTAGFTNVNKNDFADLPLIPSEKEIESIVVFYKDSTFKVYKRS